MNTIFSHVRYQAFTLLEVISVLSIIFLLTAVGLPALKSLSGASGLSGGGYQMDAFLASARQNAITKRALTAVVLLTDARAGDSAYRAFAMLEFEPGMGQTGDWKQISKWEHLPTGIIVDFNSDGNGEKRSSFLNLPNVSLQPPPLSYRGLSVSPGTGYVFQVFLPSGRLSMPPSPCGLILTEGITVGAHLIYTRPGQEGGTSNYWQFVFNDATGISKIFRP